MQVVNKKAVAITRLPNSLLLLVIGAIPELCAAAAA
jgi:hypothetical protein